MRVFSSVVLVVLLAACSSATEEPVVTDQTSDAPASTTPPPATTQTATTQNPPPAKKPMAELQKESMAANEAAWTAKDADKVAAVYTSDAIFAKPGLEGMKEENAKAMVGKDLKGLFAGFPDIKLRTVRVIQAGNIVVAEWAVAGTNTAEAWGQKPTNKAVGYNGVSLLMFNEEGKVAREHLYADDPTVMAQMGMPGMKGRPAQPLPTGSTEWVSQAGGEEAKNTEAVKNMYAAFNKNDEKAIQASFTDDAVFVDYGRPTGDVKTAAGIAKDWAAFQKAFPDIKFDPKTVIGAGKYVVVEGTFNGTMNGKLGPLKPTKKNGTMHFLDVLEMKEGKVAKLVSYNNGAEFMAAFLPPPPAKKEAAPKK